MANFVRRLKRESRFLTFAQSMGALVFGFLAWSGLLILLDLYDAYSPIQEKDAIFLLCVAVAISVACFLALFVRAWLNRPDPKELAKQVESSPPIA